MVEIYYAAADIPDEATRTAALSYVDAARREKALSCKNERERDRRLTASVLLQYAMQRALLPRTPHLELSYTYGAYGKPAFRAYPGYAFSISHSGGYAACALCVPDAAGPEDDALSADGPFAAAPRPAPVVPRIGLDLQEHRSADYEALARRFFSGAEQALLAERSAASADGASVREAFYRLWSAKEAYLKYTGRGLGEGLDAFQINRDFRFVLLPGRKQAAAYLCEPFHISGYSCALCLEAGDTAYRTHRLCLTRLLA